MHCVQFEMRLNQLLDDRRDPGSELELAEHARECPNCADLLLGNEMLLQGVAMRMLDEPIVGRDLAVRVAAEVAASSYESSWRRWSWIIPTVAAAMLLAVALWHRLGGVNGAARPGQDPMARSGDSRAPNDDAPYRGLYARTVELTQEFREHSPQWAEQMADGLKPVAASMSAALHGLRRTFSGSEPGVRSSQFEPPTLSRVAAIA
jgi:hypothetical protein